jgi:hypothetical protein
MSMRSEIRSELQTLEAISLLEVNRAGLLTRRDCKYLFSVKHVPGIIREISKEYQVLEIDSLRSHLYQTFYYDTPSLDMYLMHHNGRVNRHKIRVRKYGTSDNMFLEVKRKNSRGITVKNRVQTNGNRKTILSTEEEFLSSYTPYQNETIEPVLENSFNRITLVRHDQSERVTIDYHIWFSSMNSEESLELPGIAIAEIKYLGHLSGSPMHMALRKAGITPNRFSKYCIGMAMLNPCLKQNLFKEKVRLVNKINCAYQQPENHRSYA